MILHVNFFEKFTLMKFSFSTISRKFLRKRRPGETLIEVIMALFVVAVGSAAATSLIVTAIQANSFSRDNLIALNLAVEGIESMRNIRDTNWLRFGFNKEDCWNINPAETACTPLSDTIVAGDYTVDLNPNTFQWTLTQVVSGGLDLSDAVSDADYRLNYIDVDPTGLDSDGNGTVGDDPDLYVSKGAILLISGLTDTGESKFYRSIIVSYPATCPQANQCMDITSLVQWKVGNRVDRVQLRSFLTDYDKVKKT